MWIFQFIRFPNLLIVALTQYLLYHLLLLPNFQKAGISPTLDPFHFFLLVLITVLIAASGYVINDLIDYKKDLHHAEKSKRPLSSGRITKNQAIVYACSLLMLAEVSAFILDS